MRPKKLNLVDAAAVLCCLLICAHVGVIVASERPLKAAVPPDRELLQHRQVGLGDNGCWHARVA